MAELPELEILKYTLNSWLEGKSFFRLRSASPPS